MKIYKRWMTPEQCSDLRSCLDDMKAVLDGSFRYDDNKKPSVDEALGIIAVRAACIVAGRNKIQPSNVLAKWAGDVLGTELQLMAERLSQYQEDIAEQARNN